MNSDDELSRLRERLELVENLANHMPAMLAYWDASLRCRFANNAYEVWFGVSPQELIGKHISELLGPLYPLNLPFITKALAGEEQTFERVIPDPRGGPPRHSQAHYVPRIVNGEVLGFFVLVVDISERKRLQERVMLTDRLASLGTLAAGVGHEVNNPLAYVLTNLELLEIEFRQKGGSSGSLELIEGALDGARRIGKIVRGLTALSRDQQQEVISSVDVRRPLEVALRMVRNQVENRAVLHEDYGEVPRVDADEGKLVQTFVNLLVNAAQAIAEGHAAENRVTVRTSTAATGHALIEIGDTGEGIPSELTARIFEPFFTTKPVGAGTGLGLSVANNIVTSLGGEIRVDSQKGRGTRMQIVLPASQQAEAPDEAAAQRAAPAKSTRVLIIDDEPRVAQAWARALHQECDVTVTANAKDALALLAEQPFDLIIADLMMPEISGMELHAMLLSRDPQQAERIVFVTGGAFTPSGSAFLASVPNRRLAKPVAIDTLLEIAREFAKPT